MKIKWSLDIFHDNPEPQQVNNYCIDEREKTKFFVCGSNTFPIFDPKKSIDCGYQVSSTDGLVLMYTINSTCV